MTTLQEAREILDEVFQQPENRTTAPDHRKIADAWEAIKRELDKTTNEISFAYKEYDVTILQRKAAKKALIVVKDKDGRLEGWPHRDENSFIADEDFAGMLDHSWKIKGAEMPDY